MQVGRRSDGSKREANVGIVNFILDTKIKSAVDMAVVDLRKFVSTRVGAKVKEIKKKLLKKDTKATEELQERLVDVDKRLQSLQKEVDALRKAQGPTLGKDAVTSQASEASVLHPKTEEELTSKSTVIEEEYRRRQELAAKAQKVSGYTFDSSMILESLIDPFARTKKDLNDFSTEVVKYLRTCQMHDIIEAFREYFEHWTSHQFGCLRPRILKDLKCLLLAAGVKVPNTGDGKISSALAAVVDNMYGRSSANAASCTNKQC